MQKNSSHHHWLSVTPLAGVWVEILDPASFCAFPAVTPLAGVWVEIPFHQGSGLLFPVTPLAGVWVEILTSCCQHQTCIRHSPCGSVG